ncbi:MAG TPA: DUF1007 family protein [Methylocella sp.]
MNKCPRARLFLSMLFVGISASAAAAHPHVWVTARAQVVFNAQGQIEAIRNAWVFDEMYSAFATQGLGKDGQLLSKDELAPLAKTNVESLEEFDYFTYAKAASQKIEFGAPADYSLEQRQDKLVVLRFTLPLKTPTSATRAFSFQVYDPTYFVAFEMEKDNPVNLAGAPKGCSINVLGSNPLAASDTKKLSESFFSGLSPGTDFGVKLASRIIVACP